MPLLDYPASRVDTLLLATAPYFATINTSIISAYTTLLTLLLIILTITNIITSITVGIAYMLPLFLYNWHEHRRLLTLHRFDCGNQHSGC